MIVFVSSAYGAPTIEGMAENARLASKISGWIANNNPTEIPIAPHITCSQWWNDADDRDKCIKLCKQLMYDCKKLYVYGEYPPTSGMKLEIELAQKLQIPIIYVKEEQLSPVMGDLKLVPFNHNVWKDFENNEIFDAIADYTDVHPIERDRILPLCIEIEEREDDIPPMPIVKKYYYKNFKHWDGDITDFYMFSAKLIGDRIKVYTNY